MRGGSLRLGAAIAALAMLFVTSGSAVAAGEIWSLTPTAVTIAQGQSGTLTFTATNLTPVGADAAVIGCVRLNVPSSFTIHSVTILSPSGGSWTTAKQGTAVLVQAVSPANGVEYGESVRFSITVTPNTLSTYNFGGTAYANNTCAAPSFGSVIAVSVTVQPGGVATPTPTPIPTVVPTPVPTAVSTPTATATATATPTSTRPVAPTRSPSPSPSASAFGSESASETRSELPTTTPAETGTASPWFVPSGLTIGSGARPGSDDDVSVDVSLATSLDGIAWSVPTVAVGLPGVAVILWVAAQTAGGAIWLPWVRRLRRPRDRHRAVVSPH